jgi:hypothetical protein
MGEENMLNILKLSGNFRGNGFMPVDISIDHPSFASHLPFELSFHRGVCHIFYDKHYFPQPLFLIVSRHLSTCIPCLFLVLNEEDQYVSCAKQRDIKRRIL